MPREPRTIEPGVAYHLISRFVDRHWFITKPAEREHYLSLLGKALMRTDWLLLAFAIMSNHIHLAAIAGYQKLDAWIRRVHSPFAGTLNRTYDRIGPIFARGPKAYRVTPDRLGHLIAYIHNNPVRAGLCPYAVDSSWTSHRAYVGRGPVPPWLHVAEGLAATGVRDPALFDRWVDDPEHASDDRFSVGAHELEVEVALATQRTADLNARVSARAELADVIVHATAAVTGVEVAQLRGAGRGAREVTARAAAVQSAAAAGLTQQAIAGALCLSQQRVSVLCRQRPSDEVRAIAGRVTTSVALEVFTAPDDASLRK